MTVQGFSPPPLGPNGVPMFIGPGGVPINVPPMNSPMGGMPMSGPGGPHMIGGHGPQQGMMAVEGMGHMNEFGGYPGAQMMMPAYPQVLSSF